MSARHPSGRGRRGFTLVELLIVVVILAILAAIAIPSFSSNVDEAERAQFVQSLRSIVTACQIASEVNGYAIEDAGCGKLPTELEPFLPESAWARDTPLGGLWDSEKDSFGITSAVGVHFHGVPALPDSEMMQVDALFDDGSLSTGAFRKIANGRFYYVLVD